MALRVSNKEWEPIYALINEALKQNEIEAA